MRFVAMENMPPVPDGGYQSSQFNSTLSSTIELLKKELRLINASDELVQLSCEAGQIRRDGWPRSDCRASPPVAVTFSLKDRSVTMPCNTYSNWHCNLRAIALSLQALRAVDRYGVSSNGEQYRGWTALTYQPDHFHDVPSAAAFLCKFGGGDPVKVRSEITAFKACFKRACVETHPDNGGNSEDFKAVMKAKELIETHLKV